MIALTDGALVLEGRTFWRPLTETMGVILGAETSSKGGVPMGRRIRTVKGFLIVLFRDRGRRRLITIMMHVELRVYDIPRHFGVILFHNPELPIVIGPPMWQGKFDLPNILQVLKHRDRICRSPLQADGHKNDVPIGPGR